LARCFVAALLLRERNGACFGFDETHLVKNPRVGRYREWLAEVALEYLQWHQQTGTVIAEGSPMFAKFYHTREHGKPTRGHAVEAIETASVMGS